MRPETVTKTSQVAFFHLAFPRIPKTKSLFASVLVRLLGIPLLESNLETVFVETLYPIGPFDDLYQNVISFVQEMDHKCAEPQIESIYIPLVSRI